MTVTPARFLFLLGETRQSTLREVLVYCVVGIAATMVYFAVSLVLLHASGASSPIASLIGYPLSTTVSYLGHRGLTFRYSASHAWTLPRFLIVSFCGFALSYSIPLVVTERLGLAPMYSFCLVVV